MHLSSRLILLILFFLSTNVLSANPIKFCKCTCGQNSTIVELTKFALTHLPNKPAEPIDVDTLMDNVCMNCTRHLCGIVSPKLCDGAAVDEEIVPLCFQRDSVQDELIVKAFIILVAGLLVWAALKDRLLPVYQRVMERYGYNIVRTENQ